MCGQTSATRPIHNPTANAYASAGRYALENREQQPGDTEREHRARRTERKHAQPAWFVEAEFVEVNLLGRTRGDRQRLEVLV